MWTAVADLGGRTRRVPPPYGPKFSQFHAVFHKIWQKSYVGAPPWRVGAPSYGESWIRPDKCKLPLIQLQRELLCHQKFDGTKRTFSFGCGPQQKVVHSYSVPSKTSSRWLCTGVVRDGVHELRVDPSWYPPTHRAGLAVQVILPQ